MFDLGWTELLVIGIVALIVVGPKDLPGMFKAVGNFVGKAKRMAREFSQAMHDAADDAGVSDVQKTLRAASNPMKSAMDEVKKSTEGFTKATMESGKPKLSPERAEMAEKIRTKSAEMASERLAREKAATETPPGTAPGDTPAKSAKAPAAKSAAKPATKPKAAKPAAKPATKPAAKKTPARKAQVTKAAKSAASSTEGKA